MRRNVSEIHIIARVSEVKSCRPQLEIGAFNAVLNCEIRALISICIRYDIFSSVWVATLIRFPAGWILSFAATNSPHHIVATCRSSLDQIRLPGDIRLWKSNWVRIASYRWLSDPISYELDLNNCCPLFKLPRISCNVRLNEYLPNKTKLGFEIHSFFLSSVYYL